ncbi:MAG TPA: zf-HC2 domain-containing protein [Pyrinomonadaceae bacterium]|nr:zf-HC2 domain-containing protein [Pyrinomonadaceae bacterium]
MSCEEAQQILSLYVDDELTLHARAACDEHLGQCPVCRAQLAELRSIRRSLVMLERPVPPPDLISSISDALMIEAAARQRQPLLPLHVVFAQWLRPRIMPYMVGAFASVLLFFSLFTGLRPHLMTLRDLENSQRAAESSTYGVFIAHEDELSGYDLTKPVTADVYASGRAPYAVESPSLNPRGALATMTWSGAHKHRHASDDDMIVVADVFRDGQASLADVMQAPRDRRMLDDFQQALRKNAAFVPASLDRRPETMRVVFVVHKVDVSEHKF